MRDFNADVRALLQESLEKDKRVAKAKEIAKRVDAGKDPASPYIRSTSPVEKTLKDIMNNRGYRAYFKQSYMPIAKESLKDNVIITRTLGVNSAINFGKINPTYTPVNGADYAYGMITIAGMIDLVDQGDSFEFAKYEDMVEVRDICTKFNALYARVESGKIAEMYIAKMTKFIEMLDRSIARIPGRKRDVTLEDLLKPLGG